MFPFPVSVFLRLILLSIFPSTLADSVTICWRTKATEGRSARWRNTVVISATCEKTGSLWSLCCQPPDKDLSPLSIICLFIYFWPHHAACRILVPQPGIKSVPPAVGAQSHNHKPPQGSPELSIFYKPSKPGFDPWVRKILWRRAWLPTPAFLPGELRGQRSQTGYSPWGCKESDTTELLTLSFFKV